MRASSSTSVAFDQLLITILLPLLLVLFLLPVGHTLGLQHDGTSTTTYYQGHPNGHWAPIMGTAFYKPISQWSRGEYADANNREDDALLIRQKLGTALPAVPYTTWGNAANMNVVSATATTKNWLNRGIIDLPGAAHWYRIVADAAGTVSATVAVTPSNAGFLRANFDARLTLINAATMGMITSQDPTTAGGANDATMGTSLTAMNLAAGPYFLRVQSVAVGDRLTSGYPSYGSVGQYTLRASYSRAVNITIVSLARSSSTNPWYGFAVISAIDSQNGAAVPVTVVGRWAFTYANGTPGFTTYDVTLTTIIPSGTGGSSSNGVAPTGPGTFTFSLVSVSTPGVTANGVPATRTLYVS